MTFSRVRNSGTAELGGSGLESHEFADKMLPGCCLQKACLGLEDPLPWWLTPMAGKLMLAVGRRPDFLTAWLFGLLWCPPVWVANLPRVSNPRRNEEMAVFFTTWPWKLHTVPSTEFYWPPRPTLIHRGRVYTVAWTPEKRLTTTLNSTFFLFFSWKPFNYGVTQIQLYLG